MEKDTQLRERDTQINRQQRELQAVRVKECQTKVLCSSCDVINLVS